MGYEQRMLSMRDYLNEDGLSSSALAMADESMSKFYAYLKGQIKFESKSLSLGTEVHLALENWEDYLRFRVVKPEGLDYRTKEGIAFKKNLHYTQSVIDVETMGIVKGCVESYESSNDPLISIVRDAEGENEVSHFWTEHSLIMKARADRLVTIKDEGNEYLAEHWPSLFNPISNTIVVDFKTTSKSATRRSFEYAVRDYHYALKAAHYLEGFKADAFLWIVLETSPPYHVTRYLMSPDTAAYYAERRRVLLNQIIECTKSGVWPGLYLSDEDTLL